MELCCAGANVLQQGPYFGTALPRSKEVAELLYEPRDFTKELQAIIVEVILGAQSASSLARRPICAQDCFKGVKFQDVHNVLHTDGGHVGEMLEVAKAARHCAQACLSNLNGNCDKIASSGQKAHQQGPNATKEWNHQSFLWK